MKKYVFVIFILALVIFASGCTQNNQNNQTTSKYSVGGISFDYPENWIVLSQTLENNSIISLRDPEFQKSNGTKGDVMEITKQPSRTNLTYQTIQNQILNKTNQTNNITNGNINITGVSGNLTTLTLTTPNGTTSQLKLIYFQKNNLTYIITFITTGVDVQNQQQYFDSIIKSFKAV
jgi:hypothetical protein